MKYSSLIFTIWLPFLSVHAQNQVFDPLLDETCKTIINDKEESWNSCYMWYPGQLSAHLQRIQKEKSEARCINVSYPGNSTKDENRAYFRKEVKLSEETDIRWHAQGKTDFYIDGQKQSSKTGKYKIK